MPGQQNWVNYSRSRLLAMWDPLCKTDEVLLRVGLVSAAMAGPRAQPGWLAVKRGGRKGRLVLD